MSHETEKATSELAAAGVLSSPPTKREMQLATLNEALNGRVEYPLDPRHDRAITVLVGELDDAALRVLAQALADVDTAVAEEIDRRDQARDRR